MRIPILIKQLRTRRVLEFYNGELYEGTGHYNKSILAKVDLNSGALLQEHDLASKYFGEGITILNDTIYQITWNEHVCLMYDMEFNPIGQFSYTGEGWGLTNDGNTYYYDQRKLRSCMEKS